MFMWAFSVAETRSFDVTTSVWEEGEFERGDMAARGRESESEDEAMPMTALTPFMDFMNHSCFQAGVNVIADGWFPPGVERCVENKGFHMRVSQPVEKGEELFISYGMLDNYTLFAHHGFAVRGNPWDKITLALDEPNEDTGPGLKRIMLLGMGREGLGFEHALTMYEPLPEGLLASMRILLLDDTELEAVTIRSDVFTMLTPGNERAVFTVLGEMLRPLNVFAEAPPRTAKPDSGLGIFEQFCDTYVASRSDIIEKSMLAFKARKAAFEAANDETKL